MSEKEVTQAFVSYVDQDGNWQTALRGQKITVHKDDSKRVEAAGAFDKPAAVETVSES